MRPNKLELKILAAAKKAQRKYQSVSNGFWLWHAPESFWQTVMVQELARSNSTVYSDISINQIKRDITWYKSNGHSAHKGRGRPLKCGRMRPDISVWSKSKWNIRAIIELKRTYSPSGIRKDAEKVEKMLRPKSMRGVRGYLLVYTDVQGTETRGYSDRRELVRKTLNRWTNALDGWKTFDPVVKTQISEKECAWGFVLIRFDKYN